MKIHQNLLATECLRYSILEFLVILGNKFIGKLPQKTKRLKIEFVKMRKYEKFRTLNVIDDFNREALAIVPSKSITAKRVVMELGKLALIIKCLTAYFIGYNLMRFNSNCFIKILFS
jgi:hypothetical protein